MRPETTYLAVQAFYGAYLACGLYLSEKSEPDSVSIEMNTVSGLSLFGKHIGANLGVRHQRGILELYDCTKDYKVIAGLPAKKR